MENKITYSNTANSLCIQNGMIEVIVDLYTGQIDVKWEKGCTIQAASSGYRWHGRDVSSLDYKTHRMLEQPEVLEDDFGKGLKLTIVHESAGLPELRQHCYLYEDLPFLLFRVELLADEVIKSNRLSVLGSSIIKLTSPGNSEGEETLNVLRVPFDNDKWVRYLNCPMPSTVESYEVSAIYGAQGHEGLVIGSLSHDLWKTGITVRGEASHQIAEIEIYGGITDKLTRDSLPHGYVNGKKIESPLVFVGFYEDYRDGLEDFGHGNAVKAPKLPWDGGVPFGWNSWSAAADKLDYDLYVSTSRFFKEEVPEFQNNEALYINFDSFWTNLSQQQMKDAVSYVHNNGHKAGTYWTPFAYWGEEMFSQVAEGTNGQYTHADLLLRDWEGEVLPNLDGGLALDPTHPGTLQRIDWFMEQFISAGFEYIKLDFMGHGALEGKHYNPEITTGMAAYHFGMAYLADKLSEEKIGSRFFINLSIAPLFPHQFAHSRRVSCDAFGTLADTEYMLNSVTHGWWINNTVYRFNDPDHTVLFKSTNHESTTPHEGRSRLTASVIAGTVLLMGDDYRSDEAAQRAKAWLTNPDILEIARAGKTFKPAHIPEGCSTADVFIRTVSGEGTGEDGYYVAVFNFEMSAVSKTVSATWIGAGEHSQYRLIDLWEGKTHQGQGDFTVDLEPAESKLYRIEFK